MILILFGSVLFIFRVWLVEIKLKEELQFRRRYFSRFFAYYMCLALAFNLMAIPFNIMVMVAFPILVVTSVWDVNFYRRLHSQPHWSERKRWAVIERITLHPPVVILAIYMILTNARNYIQSPNLILIILTILVLFAPFFLVDERWTKRYNWPQALIVIGLLIMSGTSLLIAESVLWSVPIW